MEEMQALQTKNQHEQVQWSITQPSPEEYDTILSEISSFIYNELTDDEWLGQLIEREE